MGTLEGQVALVTGAGRGFGRAIAERFAAEGAKVAVLSRSRKQLEEVAAAIRAAGGEAPAVEADVTDPEAVDAAASEVEATLGPVDVLVSNAGVPGPIGPIWEVDPDEWWRAQGVHIRAPMLLLARVLPGMIERRRGHALRLGARQPPRRGQPLGGLHGPDEINRSAHPAWPMTDLVPFHYPHPVTGKPVAPEVRKDAPPPLACNGQTSRSLRANPPSPMRSSCVSP